MTYITLPQPQPCPTCGTCPTCGRRPTDFQPPFWRQPVQVGPTYTGTPPISPYLTTCGTYHDGGAQ